MIIPAIIPTSEAHLKESLAKLSFAEEIQIDVVDGDFVEFSSWPYDPKGSPVNLKEDFQKFLIEVDLMVAHPENAVDAWQKAGVRKFVVHLESLENPFHFFRAMKTKSIELGLSILNDSPLEHLYPYLDQISYVQLMGIEKIGQQGQPFDSRVIDRIATLRALFPRLVISVDGSVNKETIKSLKDAGADRFVAGSSVLKAEDPKAAVVELLKIIA